MQLWIKIVTLVLAGVAGLFYFFVLPSLAGFGDEVSKAGVDSAHATGQTIAAGIQEMRALKDDNSKAKAPPTTVRDRR